MGVKGTVLAQEAHIVSVLPPQNTTGGVTGLIFHLKDYAHASILIQAGALAAGATAISLFSCTDESGDGAAAQAFDMYLQSAAGAGNDTFATGSVANTGRTPEPTGTFTPVATANTLYCLELDAAALPQGSPYVKLTITNGANADYYAVTAVLSGGRYTGDQSPTVTT